MKGSPAIFELHIALDTIQQVMSYSTNAPKILARQLAAIARSQQEKKKQLDDPAIRAVYHVRVSAIAGAPTDITTCEVTADTESTALTAYILNELIHLLKGQASKLRLIHDRWKEPERRAGGCPT